MALRRKQVKTFSYSTDKKTLTFDLPIGLSTKFELFFNLEDVPECVRAHLSGYRTMRFDSFHALENAVDSAIERLESSYIEETKERVICYFISHGNTTNHADGSHSIDIAYRVLWESRVGKDTRYLEHRNGAYNEVEPFPYLNDRNVTVQTMPWTEAREAWFESVIQQMETLARYIQKGMGKESGVLSRKIDQNMQLVLTGGSDE